MKTAEEIKKALEMCGVIRGRCKGCPYDRETECVSKHSAEALEYVKQLESQNQPETLVRCEECTRYMPEPMGDMMMCYGFANGHFPAPDDFCSRGVRRK